MDDEFDVTVTRSDGAAVVRVAGEVDAATAPLIEQQLRAEEAEHGLPREVVIDLREVRFMDSSGLSALVVVHKRLQRAGASLVVTNATPSVTRLFEIAGLDRVLTIR